MEHHSRVTLISQARGCYGETRLSTQGELHDRTKDTISEHSQLGGSQPGDARAPQGRSHWAGPRCPCTMPASTLDPLQAPQSAQTFFHAPILFPHPSSLSTGRHTPKRDGVPSWSQSEM
eukprot:4467820-Amphidinium_carterae.1